MDEQTPPSRNVLGGPLKVCGQDPVTGFFRDSYCHTCEEDVGLHVVCAEMTEVFLQFSASVGNDLSTLNPQWGFPGLKAGDRWCLCALRWREAYQAGFAPPVILAATHEAALNVVPLEELQTHATA